MEILQENNNQQQINVIPKEEIKKPHGGRIAYPKYYWKIMSCKSIDSDTKKEALRTIRTLYNNPESLSVTIWDIEADWLDEAFSWSETSQGYDFWQNISSKIY